MKPHDVVKRFTQTTLGSGRSVSDTVTHRFVTIEEASKKADTIEKNIGYRPNIFKERTRGTKQWNYVVIEPRG